MRIHILDTNRIPERGDAVKANCRKDLVFYYSIGVDLYADARVCEECFVVHAKNGKGNFCLAFFEFESDEEANIYFERTGLNRRARLGPNQQDPTVPISVTTSPPARIGAPPFLKEKVR